MEERHLLHGLYKRFESIKMKADMLLRWEKSGEDVISLSDVEVLIQEFNDAVLDLAVLGVKVSVQRIDEDIVSLFLSYASEVASSSERGGQVPKPMDRLRSMLLRIITRCDGVLGALETLLKPQVPPKTLNVLRGLRGELDRLIGGGLNGNIHRNLLEAISECEEGHYLASAMIASRAIIYIIEQIGGNKTTKEIVKTLVDAGLIPRDRKDEQRDLLMAVRTARNFLSHRVDIYPGPGDALTLLGASVKLARIYLKWLQKKR